MMIKESINSIQTNAHEMSKDILYKKEEINVIII